tara:strand:+ start:1060 stop:3423 length:2364 start_codon:yes stop_codon:yes gene_type:complete
MKINFFKYLVFIIFNGFLFSETYSIYGFVKDSNTFNVLSNVNVYLENQNVAITTNEEGFFNLSFKESQISNNGIALNDFPQINLNIQLVGYEKKIISIDLSDSSRTIDLNIILLKNKSIELGTTHVHSSVNESNQISDILISGEDLNENLKGNLASTLSNYPNIGINSFGATASKPSLRGFSGDRFLLTKDGNTVGDLSQSSIDHAIALDMTEVNQIEIIRGPKSLLYGPNTIGGVINTSIVGNPKMRVDKLSTKIIFGSESFNPKGSSLYNQGLYGNVFLYIPVNNNQFNLSFNKRINENQSSPLGILENTNSNTGNYKVGFTHYNVNNYYLNFIIENFNMEYGIPPTPSGHTTGIDIPLFRNSIQFNYHHDLSFNIFNEINIKYNHIDYSHKEIINTSDTYEVLLAKKTSNLKVELNSENLLLGSEFSVEKFEPDGFYLTPVTDEMNISFYGFYERTFNDFDFLSSFRMGYFSINPGEYNFSNGNSNLILTDSDGEPILDDDGNRISLVRSRIFRNLSFSFGVRKKINKFEINSWIMHTMRPPRVEELYSDGPHLATYAFEIGNPNLKSEKIYGIENSLSYSSNMFDFSIVGFYNYSPYYFQMTKDGNCEDAWEWDPSSGLGHPCPGVDWIDWGSAPLGWLYEYSPKGNEVTIKGFEINLGYHLENFQFNYNFSFVEGFNKTLKMPLSYMNPMKQVLNFEYTKNFMNYNIRLSKIHAQDKLGEFETYTPGVLLTDFILTYNFGSQNIIVQFNNIFNETHYNHLSRIKDIIPERGRNIHFIYKIFF